MEKETNIKKAATKKVTPKKKASMTSLRAEVRQLKEKVHGLEWRLNGARVECGEMKALHNRLADDYSKVLNDVETLEANINKLYARNLWQRIINKRV